MLQIGVVTLFPEMLEVVTGYGITGRAVKNDLLRISSYNPRDYTHDAHRSVDDRPYGGGPGMVMVVQPLTDAIRAARAALPGAQVVYLTPQGNRLGQSDVAVLAAAGEIILVAGRYEGIDERIIATEIDAEWSIGDYVLSGGELPAMVLIDAMARTVPGVLGHDESAQLDSFAQGLLDYPHYTRPETVGGLQVPAVLLSGDHEGIRRWRLQQALGRTWQRRPDLLDAITLDDEQEELLQEYQKELLSKENQAE